MNRPGYLSDKKTKSVYSSHSCGPTFVVIKGVRNFATYFITLGEGLVLIPLGLRGGNS